MFFLYKSEWNHPDNVSIAKTNYIFSLIQQCGDDLRTFTAINEKKEAYICECDVFICKNHHIAFSHSPPAHESQLSVINFNCIHDKKKSSICLEVYFKNWHSRSKY